MPRYSVTVPEVWYQTYIVDAENEEDAMNKVQEREVDAEDDLFEYSHQMERYTYWEANEIKDGQ